MDESHVPRISVVIATYNRVALLRDLLRQLADQTIPAADYEVLVVDDGSREPVRPALESIEVPYALRIEEQKNAGAAAARQRAAKLARGELLVFLDDDMGVGRELLEAHARAHPPGERLAVLGVLRRTGDHARAPLFHRWHQTRLEEFYAAVRAGRREVHGWSLYTGNLSVRRDDFMAVGGFDATLGRSEDAELGMRLEQSGVRFAISEEAWALNAGDHRSARKWRRVTETYGATDVSIARKHPERRDTSPWRYFDAVNPLLPPVIVGAALVPPVSRALGAAVYAAGAGLGRLGLERPALLGATLTYALDYLRGVRGEMGSAGALLADLARHLAEDPPGKPRPRVVRAVRTFASAVRADHAQLRHYGDKYGHDTTSGRLASDAVRKIGLQMLVAIRLMRLFRDAGLPLAAQATSRMIRHAYGSDIHWDAEIAPGVVIAHGFGIAISHSARIGPGCILCHNVSIGLARGADGASGSPTLEANVHVGPGSILIGPITVGESSKIMAGSVLHESVPPRSLVSPPEAVVEKRGQRKPVTAA